MFICDKVTINKYEYCIQNAHIQEIFKEANKRNIGTLVLAEQHQRPVNKHKWIHLSKEYNINLMLTKEMQCFMPFSNNKIPFLFVSRNNLEYNTVKRLSDIVHAQHIPFLNEEAFDYFERLGFEIWYRKNEKIIDFFTEKTVSGIPKMPFKDSDIEYFHTFNVQSVTSYDSFFSYPVAIPHFPTHWEIASEDSDNKNDILSNNMFKHIDECIDKNEQARLSKEIEWLQKSNHYKVFLLASQLKEKIKNLEFKGSFHNFLLSHKMGLINRIPKKLANLTDDYYPDYIFFTHPMYEKILDSTTRSILNSMNSQLKIPFSREPILFCSVIEWFKKSHSDIDMELIILYKDLYDEKSYEEKLTFFEDMKFYFLLHPGAEEAFKHAIYFSEKQIFKRKSQTNRLAIVEKGEYKALDDYINVDIEELKEHLCPTVILNFNKKALNLELSS
ncbi:hypothetical protein bcgnr5369_10430 [Bacillus cereus]|uniref:hypothetical protein n=1 Tax=Bacillus cereus TaxID=1396 RepID=UPI000BFE5E90|nr:hypothetical protein [Bacillus cereus]PGP12722.1 hypothetical protein COA01_33425 [Bacillus cereus]